VETSQLELTPSARVVMIAAYGLARSEQAPVIDSRHVFAALLERPKPLVRALIERAGIDAAGLLGQLGHLQPSSSPHDTFASNATLESLLTFATSEAKSLGDEAIDDHHLLLGILLSDSQVRDFLAASGLSINLARGELWQLRKPAHENAVSHPTPEPATAVKLRDMGGHLRLTSAGALTVLGPRPGWSRQAVLPTRQIRGLWAATQVSPVFLALIATMVGSSTFLATTDPSFRLARLLIIATIVSGWVASVCVHEYGHAAMAYLGGDRSVADSGALTLDPRRYLNPFFSIIMPLIALLIGSIPLPGGSVWVRTSNLRSRNWELAVNVGGPIGTLVCLIVFSSPFWLGMADHWPERGYLWMALGGLTLVEATSLFLNLLPIPPLDGFNIISHWLPDEVRAIAAQLGYMPVFALYFALRQPGPFSDTFWNMGYELVEFLGMFASWGWYGLSLLRF
jgi:Zn-dependent protease